MRALARAPERYCDTSLPKRLRAARLLARPLTQLRLSSLTLAKPAQPSPARGEGSFLVVYSKNDRRPPRCRPRRRADPLHGAHPGLLSGAGIWRALSLGALCQGAVRAAAEAAGGVSRRAGDHRGALRSRARRPGTGRAVRRTARKRLLTERCSQWGALASERAFRRATPHPAPPRLALLTKAPHPSPARGEGDK